MSKCWWKRGSFSNLCSFYVVYTRRTLCGEIKAKNSYEDVDQEKFSFSLLHEKTLSFLCGIFMNDRHTYNFSYKKRSKQIWTEIRNKRAVWKVRGVTLLLRVGGLWRCDDGLFYEVPPLASDALLTTFHPLLEYVLQIVDHFEISCLGAPFSWLEKLRNLMGRDLDCMADVLMGFHRSTFSKPNTEFHSYFDPCDFWAFPTMKMELRGKKFRSDQRSAARFREVGGAL
jgi:hypothetical protein